MAEDPFKNFDFSWEEEPSCTGADGAEPYGMNRDASDPGSADLGYACIDLERKARQGMSEVLYGAGKTAEQIAGILSEMHRKKQEPVLVTRVDPEKAERVTALYDGKTTYYRDARILLAGDPPAPDGRGEVLVLTGGTSDIPVAEEAAVTLTALGNRVKRVYDVGVAGLHRLLAHRTDIEEASVIIAVAGMEGALASVTGGLARCPVIAVPTSVGYGASFHGLSALLSMLNSCASGITVVNIDNGFGAAVAASRMNHMR